MRTRTKKKFSIEVEDTPEHFRFRLCHEDGRKGAWVAYTGVSIIGGYCAVSPYYVNGQKCEVLTAVEFLHLNGKATV